MAKHLSYLVITLLLFSCSSAEKEEQIIERKGKVHEWNFSNEKNCFDSNHGLRIWGGNYFSEEQSCHLVLEEEYNNLQVELSQFQKGDELIVSSKLKGQTTKITLLINYFDEIKAHCDSREIDLGLISNWTNHSFYIRLPWSLDKLNISLILQEGELAFNDLVITRRYCQNQSNGLPLLQLYIPDSSLNLLEEYKTTALENGVISQKEKKYVTGYVIDEGVHEKAKLRLKGDWTDHLQSDKDSYRIKLKKSNSYNHWRSFSIQHPSTRRYLNEWVIHEMAKMEGLLTTDFGFVMVQINDKKKGVYSIEEHFDKQLIESSNYREGPILKMDEAGTWESTLQNRNEKIPITFPHFEASVISFFKKKRTIKSEVLFTQLKEGSKLLQLLLDGHLKLGQIFDIEKLAKFYALTEIAGFNHATRWHNRRFYFNPISQKLEHIMYDVLPFADIENEEFYVKMKLKRTTTLPEFAFDNAIFLDPEFKERFLYHLNLRANESYLDSIFNILKPDIDYYEACIQAEEPDYAFDKNLFYNHVQFIQNELVGFENDWGKFISNFEHSDDWTREMNYEELSDSIVLESISINAYLTKKDSNNYSAFIENYHLNEVNIIALELDSGIKFIEKIEDEITLNRFIENPDTCSIQTIYVPKKVYFEAKNHPGKIYSKKILPWEKPAGTTTRIDLENHPFFKGGKIKITGDFRISELICLSKDTKLEIMPGATIYFENGGGLICNNGISAKGTESKPISFVCVDSSSNGLTVFGGESIFEYCQFDGLSNMNYKNWTQTGSITIYESNVKMKSVSIINSNAEDALNIIRSEFNIDQLFIDYTFSDGFDADFCTGILSNSTISNTGNDGLDFSGSQITVRNVDLNQIGDKAVSGGEHSNLFLSQIRISNSMNGIASKDQSTVYCFGLTINDAICQFLAFQKKPEYSPALLIVNNYKLSSSTQNMLIGLGSEVIVDGKYHIGQKHIDVEALYEQFNK